MKLWYVLFALGLTSLAGCSDKDNSQDSEQLATGKNVYWGKCMTCHAAGLAGAPKVGDARVWKPRIAQGIELLYKNALNGFKGSTGYMPPKGGYDSLSDDDVKAAVAYMVSLSQ